MIQVFSDNILKLNIGEIQRQLEDKALEIMNQVADLMVGYAKVFVPVETGSLRDSIRRERANFNGDWIEVRVRAGGYIINPKTNRLVDYAAAVEAKQPYMAPAKAEVEPEITMMLENGFREVLGAAI
jgi:hypothetical protein